MEEIKSLSLKVPMETYKNIIKIQNELKEQTSNSAGLKVNVNKSATITRIVNFYLEMKGKEKK